MALDIAVLGGLVLTNADGDWGGANLLKLRALAVPLFPVVIVLLIGVLPPRGKAVLVFWRLRNVLPGHRAFSVYGPADPRVDFAALRRNVGAWPKEEAEQNRFWYRLYKQVESEPAVAAAHGRYLFCRDASVLSFLLAIAVPCVLLLVGHSITQAIYACMIFLAQYVVAALSGRHYGIGFVCNVLALHSAKRITRARRTGTC